jgi:hypothetical protein
MKRKRAIITIELVDESIEEADEKIEKDQRALQFLKARVLAAQVIKA